MEAESTKVQVAWKERTGGASNDVLQLHKIADLKVAETDPRFARDDLGLHHTSVWFDAAEREEFAAVRDSHLPVRIERFL